MNHDNNDCDVGFQPGEVVCCYPGQPEQVFGVVRHFTGTHYRVRIVSHGAHDYVELGVLRRDMRRASEVSP